MYCPNCGDEHSPNSPCKKTKTGSPLTENTDPKRADEHALAGLDNPFWKPDAA